MVDNCYTRGDGLKQIDKFRDENKDKWVDSIGFRVPLSQSLLQNLKNKVEKC